MRRAVSAMKRRAHRVCGVIAAFFTAWWVHAHDAGLYGLTGVQGERSGNTDPVALVVFVVLVVLVLWMTRL